MSPILSKDFLGSPDPDTGDIVDGPFSTNEYTCPVGGRNLKRVYGSDGTKPFYAQKLLDHAMDRLPFSNFAKYIEYGPHAVVHAELGGKGGQMSNVLMAPNDPAFCICNA